MIDYNNVQEIHKTNKRSSGTNSKRFIVLHYTAGSSFDGDVAQLSVNDAKVSCHYVISRNGTIAKIGSDSDILWHAGKSSWNGIRGLNSHSIGIELTNPGILEVKGDEAVSWFGKRYKPGEWFKHSSDPNAGWVPYSVNQLEALRNLCEGLISLHGTIEEVVGHEQISPQRKVDPGNGEILSLKFYEKMNEFAREYIGSSPPKAIAPMETLPVKVSVSSNLRVRSGPGTNFAVVDSLKDDDAVEIIRKSGSWAKIGNKRWVHSAYLEIQ